MLKLLKKNVPWGKKFILPGPLLHLPFASQLGSCQRPLLSPHLDSHSILFNLPLPLPVLI